MSKLTAAQEKRFNAEFSGLTGIALTADQTTTLAKAFRRYLADELAREYVRGYQDGSGSIVTKKMANDFIKRLSKNK